MQAGDTLRGSPTVLASTQDLPLDARLDPSVIQARELQDQGWSPELISKFIASAELAKGPLVVAQNISRSFGQKKVLSGFSLNVFQGEIFGIVGVSGSGKTTVLETLAGIVRPDHGLVRLKDPKSGDLKSFHQDASLRWWVGFSPQVPSVFPELTVRENLEHFGTLMDLPMVRIKDRISQLSVMLDLTQVLDQRVSTLSRGWQKKADIAAAILSDPSLLILDEPARDLDPISRRSLYQTIKTVNAKGTTVILSSHEISELSGFCSRVGILHEGRMQKSVNPKEVSRASYDIVLRTDTGKYQPYVERLSQAAIPAKANASALRIQTTEPELVIRFLLDSTQALKEKIVDLQVNRPDIGDVFEGLVRQ